MAILVVIACTMVADEEINGSTGVIACLAISLFPLARRLARAGVGHDGKGATTMIMRRPAASRVMRRNREVY